MKSSNIRKWTYDTILTEKLGNVIINQIKELIKTESSSLANQTFTRGDAKRLNESEWEWEWNGMTVNFKSTIQGMDTLHIKKP